MTDTCIQNEINRTWYDEGYALQNVEKQRRNEISIAFEASSFV